MAQQTSIADENAGKPTPVTPPQNGRYDVITHRLIVLSLGLTVLASGITITILEAMGKEPSSALSNYGSVAIGALAMSLSSIMRPH